MKILLKSVLILFAAIFTTQKSSAQSVYITNMTNCYIIATIYCYNDPGCTLANGGASVGLVTLNPMTTTAIPATYSCGPGTRLAASLEWANCQGSTVIVGLEPIGTSCVSAAGATFYYPPGTVKMPPCEDCDNNIDASVDYDIFGTLTITP